MMKGRKKVLLVCAVALAAALTVGAVSIAGAQGGDPVDGLSEEAEAKALASLAKISKSEAEAAAEAAVGGNASETELGNENGALVYEVEIGNQEVKVDAGNGKVLSVQKDDADEGAEEGVKEED